MTPEQDTRFDAILSGMFGTGKQPDSLEKLFDEPPMNKIGQKAINEFIERLTGEYTWKQKQEFVRRFVVDIASQFEASDLLPWNEMSIAIKAHEKVIAWLFQQNQELNQQLNALESLVADSFPESYIREDIKIVGISSSADFQAD